MQESESEEVHQRTDPVVSVIHGQTLQTLSSVFTLPLLAKRMFLCLSECDLGWEIHENIFMSEISCLSVMSLPYPSH